MDYSVVCVCVLHVLMLFRLLTQFSATEHKFITNINGLCTFTNGLIMVCTVDGLCVIL